MSQFHLYNIYPIQSNPIHVNPSISKKSLMVARTSPIIKTSKGAHRSINIHMMDIITLSIKRGFTCINTYTFTLIAYSVWVLTLFPLDSLQQVYQQDSHSHLCKRLHYRDNGTYSNTQKKEKQRNYTGILFLAKVFDQYRKIT